MKLIRNNAIIFSIFETEHPDKVGKRMQMLGAVTFTIMFGALVLASAIQRQVGEGSFIFNAIVWVAAVCWILGILIFIVTGTYYIGKAEGKKNFFYASLYVLGKTFLYIFLPALLITGLMVISMLFTSGSVFNRP